MRFKPSVQACLSGLLPRLDQFLSVEELRRRDHHAAPSNLLTDSHAY